MGTSKGGLQTLDMKSAGTGSQCRGHRLRQTFHGVRQTARKPVPLRQNVRRIGLWLRRPRPGRDLAERLRVEALKTAEGA